MLHRTFYAHSHQQSSAIREVSEEVIALLEDKKLISHSIFIQDIDIGQQEVMVIMSVFYEDK